MNSFEYLGYIFTPYGNIIGKDNETRFHRIMWTTDTLHPLLNKGDGYDYYKFYKIAGRNKADIYFVEETGRHYVPTGGGICCIDINEMKEYIKELSLTA